MTTAKRRLIEGKSGYDGKNVKRGIVRDMSHRL